jgi:tetratricopeptide (TPR) repeat protein
MGCATSKLKKTAGESSCGSTNEDDDVVMDAAAGNHGTADKATKTTTTKTTTTAAAARLPRRARRGSRFTRNPSNIKQEPYVVKGVSVHYLKHDFLFEIHEAGLDQSAKIYDLEDLSKESHGLIRKKGERITCPRDGRIGAAYVDCIEGEDNVGPANLMLSYGWANTVDTITSTLYDHCISKNLNPKRTYVWICCLCNNQHRVAERKQKGIEVSFDEFQRIFYHQVMSIGNVLCLMSPWNNPIYLSRCWCLFELFSAYESDHVNIVIAMPPIEKNEMVRALNNREGVNTLFDVLSNTSVENATASEESDRIRIMSLIETGPGFSIFNQKINALLREWVNHSVMEIVEQEESKVQDVRQAAEFGMLCTYVGNVLYRYREMKQALTLKKKAIAIHSMIYGPKHPYTAASMSNYGLILKDNGDLEEAMETFENVKSIHSSTLGPDHLNTAISLNNIALCLSDKRDFDKALDYFMKCLQIYEVQLGNHSNTAGVHSNCGYVLLKQGKIDQALFHFEKSLSIRQLLFHENHPDVADNYHTLGLAYRQKGDLNQALEYHKKCLSIEEKVLGQDHPSTTTTYDSIASILFDLQEFQKSHDYYTKLYDIYTRIESNGRQGVAKNSIMNVCWNLGKTCHALGDPSGALEMYEKGLNLSNHDEGATTEASNWTEKFSTVIENIQKQINHPEEIPNRD